MAKTITLISILFAAAFPAEAAGEAETYDEFLDALYRDTVPMMSSDELRERLDSDQNVVLIDVRSESERAVSAIPGSVFEDFDTFDLESARALDGVDRETLIVTYCAVGWRSERVGEELIAAGYTNVFNLYGGVFEWISQDKPIKRGVAHPDRDEPIVHGHQPRWGKWLSPDKVTYEPAVD